MRIAILILCCVFIVSCGKPTQQPVVKEKPTSPKIEQKTRPSPEVKPKPYAYRLVEKRDVSYATTKRMVYSVYLNTQETPDQERMRATAQEIWQDGNKKWNEFTVWMIFGPIKDFDNGTYGMAEFTPSGLTEFRINDIPLQMLAIESKTRPPAAAQPQPTGPAAKASWLDPQSLPTGQAFFVSKQTPLMPEFDPAGPLAATRLMKQIPNGGAFTVYEVRKKRTVPWYRVVAIDQNKNELGTGWINSTALLGQDLKPFK